MLQETILTIDFYEHSPHLVEPISRLKAVMSGHKSEILCMDYNGSGLLATGSGDNTVRLWDTNTSTIVKVGENHTHWVLCVKWSHDSDMLASGGMDSVVCVWDSNLKCTTRLKGHAKWITSLAWEPKEMSPLLVSGSKDSTARIWNARSGECVCSFVTAHRLHHQCQMVNQWMDLYLFS